MRVYRGGLGLVVIVMYIIIITRYNILSCETNNTNQIDTLLDAPQDARSSFGPPQTRCA